MQMTADLQAVLRLVFEVLVYPGALFLFFSSLIVQWIGRKLGARFQNRRGPTHSGPFGLLQPLADFLKLMFKEDITPTVSSDKVPQLLLSLSLAALSIIPLFTPLAPWSIRFPYDAVLVLYLLVLPSLALATIGFASYNPYAALGSSRLLTLMLGYEPAFFASILIPLFMLFPRYEFSIFEASERVGSLWTGITFVPLTVAFVVALISLQCKIMEKPFDIPHAETEIVYGPYTEYSGPKLAYIKLVHDFELVVCGTLMVYLLLGGPSPFSGILGIVAVFTKFMLIIFLVTLIRVIFGRFRIDQASNLLWRYLIVAAALNILFSSFLIPRLV
jgi:NADH-quinone oxidoreductase subunit H